jgi:hypothetical protein
MRFCVWFGLGASFGSGWRTDAAADLGDHTIAQQYYISLDHPRAVEDPDVPDQCVRAVFAVAQVADPHGLSF